MIIFYPKIKNFFTKKKEKKQLLMNKKFNGFLLFYDWYELMIDLSPKHFKMLLTAMVDYQLYGREPPEFPDKIKGIGNSIFSRLRQRMVNAENGKKGGEVRAERASRKPKQPHSLPASLEATLEAPPEAYRQDKDKTETETETETKTKQSQDNDSLLSAESAESASLASCEAAPLAVQTALASCEAAPLADATENATEYAQAPEKTYMVLYEKPEEDEDEYDEDEYDEDEDEDEDDDAWFWSDEEDEDTLGDYEPPAVPDRVELLEEPNPYLPLPYGKFQNVFLTRQQYASLLSEIPDAVRYIDYFSDKVYRKGYRYSDCYAAIRSWWKRDRELAERSGDTARFYELQRNGKLPTSVAPSGEGSGSFETDRFFEAAVARSFGTTVEEYRRQMAEKSEE